MVKPARRRIGVLETLIRSIAASDDSTGAALQHTKPDGCYAY